ncbi:hypothetical protein ASG40_11720 [Methylobacterium sp. Leaf399]|uniref:hypothetical protein n=1 Tax=Methylobacterium sp. Leaf399 TaxID=1736364 RepID=UPI0006FBDD01|nr:hypothetical protein [Methylobacterium sp. Leaf399]KQT08539.1 hypothetical protein ASG40_11720 [Methylobacterium sp. Leaf399]
MIWRCIAYLSLALISGAILTVATLTSYYLADRRSPIRVDSVEVLTPTVEIGGRLQIRTVLTYMRSCKIHSDRQMFDSANHRKLVEDVDFETAPAPLGEPQTIIQTFEVPAYFVPGKAIFQTFPWYACNAVHRYIWPIEPGGLTVEFEIAER